MLSANTYSYILEQSCSFERKKLNKYNFLKEEIHNVKGFIAG